MTDNDQHEKLTPKQDALIELLLSGVNIAAAARALKIGDKTARRWLKLEHFQQAYRAAQSQVFDTALDELRSGVSVAIQTLKRHMTDEGTAPYVQVQAASIWLEKAIDLYKMADLEKKIAELEDKTR